MSTLFIHSDNDVRSLENLTIDQIKHEADQHHYHCWLVSCEHANTKSQVLSCIADALKFPPHFGRNFDALSDCLTEMTCGDAEGMVIIVNQLPVVPHFSKKDQEVLIDVFLDTVAYFQEQKTHCFIFYQFNHQDIEKK